MPLWKDGQFGEDGWWIAPDDQPVEPGRATIISLSRWRAERQALAGRNAPTGLLLQPGDEWSDIAGDLARFEVIAVSFPKWSDGRGFSIARLLRDRDGYAGEIRAVGQFYVDQMPLMRRVGIDAFAIEDPMVLKALNDGKWPEVPFYMQPVSDEREVPEGTRPWARRPKGSPKG